MPRPVSSLDFTFEAARQNMVTQQILPNDVTDTRVIQAFRTVAREIFVPRQYEHLAYMDQDVPLRQGVVQRYVIDPLALARLVELAAITPEDTVLDIGCATGYSSAILSHLAHRVYAVECDELLATNANSGFLKQRIENVKTIIGPLEQGYAKGGLYDAIILPGAEYVPAMVEDQLKEGGRIAAILTDTESSAPAKVVLGTKSNGLVTYRVYFDTGRRVLPGLQKPKAFRF